MFLGILPRYFFSRRIYPLTINFVLLPELMAVRILCMLMSPLPSLNRLPSPSILIDLPRLLACLYISVFLATLINCISSLSSRAPLPTPTSNHISISAPLRRSPELSVTVVAHPRQLLIDRFENLGSSVRRTKGLSAEYSLQQQIMNFMDEIIGHERIGVQEVQERIEKVRRL